MSRTREYNRIYLKQYRKDHPEKVREWYEKQKEHRIQYQKEYREKNRERIRAQRAEYYRKNKHRIREARYFQVPIAKVDADGRLVV